MNTFLFPRRHTMVNKYMQQCSASLIIMKMQIKKTQGDIFSKFSNGYLHKRQEIKVVEDVEKRELLTVDGNVKWCSNYWATVCRLLKKLS